ncbi:hypothetical protein [Vannielia litorea]|uniref:hypothetical protein n=1 Tax=Vannielia litorea TaxID=1217970 RepID=UPI001BCE1F6A|nr:hypothetical protein [Vannielia litorea]MBS8228172.1 hypothetical protein [Vannielia litorea]
MRDHFGIPPTQPESPVSTMGLRALMKIRPLANGGALTRMEQATLALSLTDICHEALALRRSGEEPHAIFSDDQLMDLARHKPERDAGEIGPIEQLALSHGIEGLCVEILMGRGFARARAARQVA